MNISNETGISDIIPVLYHGLPLDLSMSGYLTALPAIILILSIWLKPTIIAKTYNIYFAIILALASIITIADIVVYPYWGFHFDSSVFLYLQNPKETFASASILETIVGLTATIAIIIIAYIGYIYIIRKQVLKLTVPNAIAKTAAVLFILTGLLFLPIRGGISVSTMNVGKVYFSENMFLNHAAINPQFNLMYSFFKSDNFASQYQFYDKEEAQSIFKKLNDQPENDSIPQLLNTTRPNILLFILESFSGNIIEELGGQKGITPNLNRFAEEGILFTNFYANSFRTDRGLVSILSGYPAHPTVPIMKYPQKTESLPTIPKSLRAEGYDLSFYYGGDADFANMRSYFVGAGTISKIYADQSFPISERMTKWGAPDKYLVDKVYTDLVSKENQEPFFETILTLSSHEPFDVPTRKFTEPFLNAAAYTDSCLGSFVDRLRTTRLWDNTLIIFVADHCMQSYPSGLNNSDPERFHIPMIWTGGAVKEPRRISEYGSQNDIAATLLSQLKIDHSQFNFSKDMLNPQAHTFAFYSYVNGFSMRDSTASVIYDNDSKSILEQTGNLNMEKEAKAFFQNMYLDLGSR